MSRSRATKVLLSIVSEQAWYREYIHVANKIQTWLLKNLAHTIGTADIVQQFEDEYHEDAIHKGIEILRANAALYPMGSGMYRINMSRISSARL